MKPSRILLVEQNTDGTIGGSHHSLLLLVKHLDRTAFEPIVAFYQAHALLDEYRRYATVVMLKDYPPVQIAGAEGPGLLSVATLGLRKAINISRTGAAAAQRLAHVVLGIRPDLIHMNNSVLTGAAWPVIARLSRAPIVAHQRGFVRPSSYVGAFDRVICISRDVHADFIRQAPAMARRTVQIYNGIETDTFVRESRAVDPLSVRRAFGVDSDEPLLGLVGNFQPWKGQNVLLQALPLLTRAPRCRCLLIGSTPTGEENQRYYAQLVDTVRTLELGDRVIFTGYRQDVGAVINAVDVLVHTSVTPEPLGRVIFEGMALEKPVVATNHGGPTEIIEDRLSGFLVPPGDPAALANCLDTILASPELRRRVGRVAAARVAREFGVAPYLSQVEAVYRTLLARSPHRLEHSHAAGPRHV